jgi:3-keto-disaccharide hydrolase
MRHLIVALALVFFAKPGLAQDGKPNTLTPKEIAEGWILLFDGESTFGWETDGPVQWSNGELLIGGVGVGSATTTTVFGDGELWLEYRQLGKKRDAAIKVEGHQAGLLAVSDKSKWIVEGFEVKEGRFARLSKGPKITRYPLTTKSLAARKIALVVPENSQLVIRNVKFRPQASQSLFSGTDLTGWKIFPGKKSDFTVSDGAIHIKNGPGDLQTEKKFGDFCLQLECISHGPHLNSGVFFRCRPNEYQNGYEAQIRNQFTEKPTQKYVLEDYDPMTHKLLGKKEAFFTAVDYGTGAIYRRQPARKDVAKDKEWFTMTIVAHDNHLATWVNGIQVTDWHDNRPPSDNARTGCRLEAGHISLQGHDPTTDLSFRNFRIQEYPK